MFNLEINDGVDKSKHQITRFMDQDAGYHVAIPSQPDPSFSMADFDDTQLQNFFSRPLKIASYTWAQSINFFQEIDPWSLFFNNPRNVNRIANFNLLRCKMFVKVLINGNGFHYGRLLVSYNPLDAAQTFVRNRALVPADNIAASQRLSFIMDPTTSMGGTMELPFIYDRNALSIPNVDWQNMGRLSIRLLNPLKHANGAVDSVQVSVFAWAEDVQLAVPTCVEPGTIAPQSGAYVPQADEYQTDSVADPPNVSSAMGRVANIAQQMASIPEVAPYAQPLAMAAGAGARVAKAMGYCKPRELEPEKHMRPTYFGTMANVNGTDASISLALDQKQSLNVDSRTMGLDGSDELQISSICARESYLTTFGWLVADPTETLLWNCRVSPLMYDVWGSPLEYHCTPMGYLANAFQYWKGSIQYRFQVVASSFHKGRLKIVWDPVASTSNEYNTSYTQVVDIAHARDFSVTIGWGSESPFLEVDPIFNNTSPPFNTSALSPSFAGNFNGVISVFVVNDLTVPDSTINNDIQINVFVKSEDIEFRYPNFRLPQTTCLSPFQPQSGAYQPQAGSPDIANTEAENKPEEVVSEAVGQTNLVTSQDTFFGDPIISLRELFKRYMANNYMFLASSSDTRWVQLDLPALPLQPGYIPNGSTALHKSSPTQQYNYTEMNYISWFAPMFLAWRGSLRHKYHLGRAGSIARAELAKASLGTWSDVASSGQDGPFILNVLDLNNSNTINRQLLVSSQFGATGTHATDVAFNPVLEVEIPYLQNNRFSYARSASRDGEPAVYLDFFTPTATSTIITDFVAAGEDFMLSCFISAPIIYSYAHPVYT